MNTITKTTTYEFAPTESGYALIAGESLALIDAARLHWNGDDLKGEVTVYSDSGVLGPVNIVFNAANSRRDVATLLSDDVAKDALNEMCSRVIVAERRGSSPVVRLRDVPRPTPEREYCAAPLPPLPRNSIAIWFGDGGTGKSLIALYVAGTLAQQGLRVLYLDWEMMADDHRIRYEQLFGDKMPSDLHHWRCERPLMQMRDTIRATIQQKRIDYVIVDSIAFACGGSAESSETAAQYALAVRSFGVGSLHLAHVSRTGKTAKHKPFGSTFWHNAARSTWYLEGKPKIGDHTTTLEWSHRKSNFGPLEQNTRLIESSVDTQNRQLIDTSKPAIN